MTLVKKKPEAIFCDDSCVDHLAVDFHLSSTFSFECLRDIMPCKKKSQQKKNFSFLSPDNCSHGIDKLLWLEHNLVLKIIDLPKKGRKFRGNNIIQFDH